MAVPEQTPYKEFTANGITKVFPLEFDVSEQEHLIVLVNDLEPTVGSWSLIDNSVVFALPPANDANIKIRRDTPLERTTDYQSYNNSFKPQPVNSDFDRIWWKLQELGVADWILGSRINALKAYVDYKDDELRAYLIEEIRKQGVALDQLEHYYEYLMDRLAQIAIDKGWDSSFIHDGNETQKEVNDKSLQWVKGIYSLRGFKKRTLSQCIAMADGSFWNTDTTGIDDGTMTVIASDGTIWKRGRAGALKLTSFGNLKDAASAFERLFTFIKTLPSSYMDNAQQIRKIDVDLEGFVWETKRAILGVQGIGGLNFINGHIKASDDFIGDYLIEFTDSVALRAYHYISWNHVIFDANRKTNCARFNRFLKCGVTTCHFLRWKENGYGLVVGKTPTDTLGAAAEAHEFFVNGQSTFSQYDFSSIWAGQKSSGTALYINTYDGHYSDFVIAYCGRGVEHIKTGLNIFENIHIYGAEEKNYGFYIDCSSSNAFINLTNIYMDECSIRVLNPNQISIANSKVFRNDASEDGLIIFDTSIGTNVATRCVMIANHFNTSTFSGKKQIQFVTDSGGSWSGAIPQDIKSCGNTILGYVRAFDTSMGGQTDWLHYDGYNQVGKYAIDKTGTFTFDISKYQNIARGQNSSATVSEWLITSNWQSSSGSGVGAYRATVFKLPSGNFSALFEPIGVDLKFNETTKTITKDLAFGFSSVPTISNSGVITVSLADFCQGAIYREDQRNYLSSI
ncbi:hypothetical protein [Acinetobacter bereziniae]|uniref:hypothetical protein n=1 Tax=Acinetobacter bereziniae TaxID=106648 RepID=UPI003AF898C7